LDEIVGIFLLLQHFLIKIVAIMLPFQDILQNETSLDPQNWDTMRQLSHKMVDDMMDFLQNVQDRPVWQKPTNDMKAFLTTDLPTAPQSPENIYKEFIQHILPFPKGNIHPRFWMWVEGTGTPLGMMADMLAAGMNVNNTIGDHAAMYVDKQVVEWSKQMMGFPDTASGILVSGASLANTTALIVARNAYSKRNIRKKGLKGTSKKLLVYTSTETHGCVQKAVQAIGLGDDAVRKVPTNAHYEMDVTALKRMIDADKAAGYAALCIVANVGTVNTGAIDPLDDILAICKKEKIWLHIDGAFGAVAKLTPEYATRLKAIEQADSLAFDFHKWMYVNYEVACCLIRDGKLHREAFASAPIYLLTHEKGIATGPETMNNYGIELSRGFKALKVWMSLKEHGIAQYTAQIRQNIAQCLYLEALINATPHLEMLVPVTLNIVCFRYNPSGKTEQELFDLNKHILMELHERGIAAPSFTILNGKYAIRVANVNHRSKKEDFEALVRGVLLIGREQ
jgi:glutamate/tyrosine decarboxylase-like PLP-dependent enzyme